jgi:hypothetical protein
MEREVRFGSMVFVAQLYPGGETDDEAEHVSFFIENNNSYDCNVKVGATL